MNVTSRLRTIPMLAMASLILSFVLSSPDDALAQWTTIGNHIYNTNTGNVGIKTSTPEATFDIAGGDGSGTFLLYPSAVRIAATGTPWALILRRTDVGPNSDVALYNGADSQTGAWAFAVGDGAGDYGYPLWLDKYGATSYLTGVNNFTLRSSGAFYGTISNPSANTWFLGYTSSVSTLGTPALSWNSSGSVGIGTTSPSRILDVVSTSAWEDGIRVTGSTVTRLDLWSTHPNAGTRNWAFRPDTVVFGDFNLLQSNARLGDPFGAGTSRLYIKNDGKVGIGTTSPSANLHVVGDVTLTGTGNITNSGNITATGTISGGNVIAKYQDVAEWVPARHALPAGTVVTLDPEHSNHVLASSRAYDTRVAGVISANPGVILGEGGEGKVMVATTGRVRVKVDATSAPIRVGDLLVTSDREGVAMRSQPLDLGGTAIHRPGTLIGKALEPLEKGVGEILVLLSLQ